MGCLIHHPIDSSVYTESCTDLPTRSLHDPSQQSFLYVTLFSPAAIEIPIAENRANSLHQASTPSTTLRPRTSTEYFTISGAIRTRYITTDPSGTGLPISSVADIRVTNQGLSNGAVAGITIGVIAAVATAGLFFFFCCWRKRKDKGGDGGINRNSSVLSKAGLLRHGSTRPTTGAAVLPVSNSAPRLDTAIPGISGPPSTSTVGMLERRDSRPLFRDNRLNPNLLTVHSNTSRTSVGTLQDNEDYSRPLKVCAHTRSDYCVRHH